MTPIEFKVGNKVRDNEGRVGTIYAIRPGRATKRLVHSVKFESPGKNPGHGFYYAEEIERVEEES